jgi:hypothetical protein
MLAIVLTINALLLVGMICAAFFAGFVLRSRQLKKSRRKIIELEREILRSDASILEMEKEKLMLLQQMKESKIPVIPMKNSKDEGDKNDQKSRHAN